MAGTQNIKERDIIAALRKWGGICALAAKELNTTRQNIGQRIKSSKKLQDAQRDIEDETLDLGEGHIIKGVREGERHYVTYYMDRKGKRRGYGQQVQSSFDDAQIEAIIRTLGGDSASYAAAIRALGADPDQS